MSAAYRDDPADLYMYDIGAYAARALAETQGRPVLRLSPTFVGWDGYEQEVAAHLRQLPGADAYRARFARWLADCVIAVPQAAEQFLNADRLVELGAARRIDTDDATPQNLRAVLIDLVGDAGVADRSARLRAETRNEGGTRRAADLIEALLP